MEPGQSIADRISDRNPFVGPRPIQQGEPLYGRDMEVRELFTQLQARRIVVLHSPSGAGKSSLVHAGLIPGLKAAGYDVWKPIRVNLDPADLGVTAPTNRYALSAMVSLEDELPADRHQSPAALAGLDFLQYVEGRPRRKSRADRPVVLLFDQFEEVLTVAPRETAAKQEFFAALGRALDTGKYWALFILREDYLGALAPYRDLIPTQLANTFRLDLLGLQGAAEVAVKLAEQGGRSFPAVDQLIRDLSAVKVQQPDGSFVSEPGLHIEPVQLQVVCRRLWAAMPEDDRSIDAEDIEKYGEVTKSLANYYADAVRAVAGDDRTIERSVREWVGQKLIVAGIRSQVRQEAGRSAGLDNRLVLQLVDSFLVRSELRAGGTWFELSHDRLVEPVQADNLQWEQANLHPLQVQARLWEQGRRNRRLLLGAEALPEAETWAQEHAALVTAEEREFLAKSREERAKEAAVQRRIRGGRYFGVVVCLALALNFILKIGGNTPNADIFFGLVIGLMVTALLAIRLPGLARLTTALYIASSYAVGFLAAFGVAIAGSIDSPFSLIHILLYTLLATHFRPSPRAFLCASVPTLMVTMFVGMLFDGYERAIPYLLFSTYFLVDAYFGVVVARQADDNPS